MNNLAEWEELRNPSTGTFTSISDRPGTLTRMVHNAADCVEHAGPLPAQIVKRFFPNIQRHQRASIRNERINR